ncbi:hypothetical protein [Shinella sp.]|uniref:hypothetical protein n=1 Tax=Shinella sp. TaxID=1870904 RepID=UPI0040358860
MEYSDWLMAFHEVDDIVGRRLCQDFCQRAGLHTNADGLVEIVGDEDDGLGQRLLQLKQ